MEDKSNPWMGKHFTEREQKEINFCQVYAKHYAHGTSGHNAMMIIAKLAQLLDTVHYSVVDDEIEIGSRAKNFEMAMGYIEREVL